MIQYLALCEVLPILFVLGLLAFVAAEACWHFDAVGFIGVVAMDAHGRSFFADVERTSRAKLDELIG